jgi:hypothetical protein
MGSFEYIVSSQKRCVVKVSTDGASTTFSLTGPAWGGTAYTYAHEVAGVQNDGAVWTIPQANQVKLNQVFYGLSGSGAVLSYQNLGGSGLTAFFLPFASDGHINFERCPIPFSNGGTGVTATQFVVNSSATTGIVMLEFVR